MIRFALGIPFVRMRPFLKGARFYDPQNGSK